MLSFKRSILVGTELKFGNVRYAQKILNIKMSNNFTLLLIFSICPCPYKVLTLAYERHGCLDSDLA